MLSTQLARTHPEVVTPASSSVSMPFQCSVAASEVPKKALGYCLVIIRSPSLTSSPSASFCESRPASKHASAGTFA